MYKLTKQHRHVHLCGSKEKSRYAICGALVEPCGRMTATNGRLLVSVPVETEGENNAGIIPSDFLADATKMANGKPTTLEVGPGWREGGEPQLTATQGGTTLTEPGIAGSFPCYADVITRSVPAHVVTFNIKYLVAICKALNADVVTIGFDPPKRSQYSGESIHSPIVVVPETHMGDELQGAGVLMPVKGPEHLDWPGIAERVFGK